MKKSDVVSIIIATYNSQKKLPKVLKAVRAQDYPQEYIEIIVIDGGSKDATLKIAGKYHCKILHNPKTEPVNAKIIGIQHASGKYLMTLDHDEVLVNPSSIKIRVRAMKKHPECKAAFCSGYQRPKHYPALNQYVSEFGDPFSLFIYQFSKDRRFLLKTVRKYYRVLEENRDYLLLSFSEMKKQPLFEVVCSGTMIDLDYFKEKTNILTDHAAMTQLFYIMLEQGNDTVIFTKQDPLVHYSVDSVKSYFPKLKWRICNNVHFSEKGENGYNGRMKYQKKLRYKKYLFLPYALCVPVSAIHGIYLACSRKNAVYLMHPVFSFYVAVQILWQMTLKTARVTPDFLSYDGKRKITR